MKIKHFQTWLSHFRTTDKWLHLYDTDTDNVKRYLALVAQFQTLFPMHEDIELFSAPGRVELCGNHTDHQGGFVLAAAISMDTIACASINKDGYIRLISKGFEPIAFKCTDITYNPFEQGSTIGLLRGLCFEFAKVAPLCGLDIVMSSNIQPGSGLSSSASFECIITSILFRLCAPKLPIDPLTIAIHGQRAENTFFGKPCGLMDQLSIASGGINVMKFATSPPLIQPVDIPHCFNNDILCVINTGGSHENLSHAYASIVNDNMLIAQHFNVTRLIDVEEHTFYESLPQLFNIYETRPLLRAIHFFEENKRVLKCIDAIQTANPHDLYATLNQSGHSSFELLHNVYHPSATQHPLALALAYIHTILGEDGAYRVHGGGFAGTVLCICPSEKFSQIKSAMDALFGSVSLTKLKIRPIGVACLTNDN